MARPNFFLSYNSFPFSKSNIFLNRYSSLIIVFLSDFIVLFLVMSSCLNGQTRTTANKYLVNDSRKDLAFHMSQVLSVLAWLNTESDGLETEWNTFTNWLSCSVLVLTPYCHHVICSHSFLAYRTVVMAVPIQRRVMGKSRCMFT